MPNQRSEQKEMVGAWFSAGLRAGIDEWLSNHPGVSQSDFLLDACLEKLKREGVKVDESEAKMDRRIRGAKQRYVISQRNNPTQMNDKGGKSSLKLPSAEAEAAGSAVERALKRRKS